MIPSASRVRAATAVASAADRLGQTCASATPNAGGSATTRSVTASGLNRPPAEKPITVTSGPGASSSRGRGCPVTRAGAPSAGSNSAALRTSERPF